MGRTGPSETIGHWIGGEEVLSSETFEVYDPSIGRQYAEACDGGPAEVDLAVEAAWKAYAGEWSALGAEERSQVLGGVADELLAASDLLADVESRDIGKPLAFARAIDGPSLGHELRFYAGAMRSRRDGLHSGDPRALGLTLRQPYGVVAVFVPSNFPLMVLAEKVSQVLAAGNCVVIKPSPFTPASAAALARLMTHAGLPAGVVNVVQGRGETAGSALCAHPRVQRISFTGSTRVGQAILAAAAPDVKRVSLELGGKSPSLVFPDADVDAAVATALLSGFLHAGQLCTSGSRILVHEAVADTFCERFVAGARDLRLGPREDPATQMSPLITKEHLERVRATISLAEGSHQTLYAGTVPAELTGWYEAPHIFKVSDPQDPVAQEEIFGPVSCVMTFSDDDEALALANSTRYGLASFVWTNDVRRIMRFVNELEAGRVWVNTGHTIPPDMTLAGWKMSGLGEEGGLEGLMSFMRTKTVNINHRGQPPSFPRFGP